MKTDQNANISYSALLQTDHWQNKRITILKRDGFKCINCGSTQGLEVHHRQYHWINKSNQFRNPWEYANTKMITLCSRCHKSGHKFYKIPVFNV